MKMKTRYISRRLCLPQRPNQAKSANATLVIKRPYVSKKSRLLGLLFADRPSQSILRPSQWSHDHSTLSTLCTTRNVALPQGYKISPWCTSMYHNIIVVPMDNILPDLSTNQYCGVPGLGRLGQIYGRQMGPVMVYLATGTHSKVENRWCLGSLRVRQVSGIVAKFDSLLSFRIFTGFIYKGLLLPNNKRSTMSTLLSYMHGPSSTIFGLVRPPVRKPVRGLHSQQTGCPLCFYHSRQNPRILAMTIALILC